MINSNEIKKTALNQLKGKWLNAILITTFFTLVNIALSYLLTIIQNLTINIPFFYYSASLIYLAIFLPLSFGLIASMKSLSKENKTDITYFLNEALLNFTKTISIFIQTLIRMIIPSLIIIVISIAILFLTVYFLPPSQSNIPGYSLYILLLSLIVFIGVSLVSLKFILSPYILANNKDMKAKDIVIKSAQYMKKHTLNFIKLMFSFLGWFLLIALVSTIVQHYTFPAIQNYIKWFGMIFLMPYIITSIFIFYEEVSEEN